MTTEDDSGSRWTRRAVSSVFTLQEPHDRATRVALRKEDIAPLGRLQSLLQTLHAHRETVDDEELQRGLAIVEASMRELNGLAFGRAESAALARGERAMRGAPVQLNDLVRFAIRRLRDVATRRQVCIRWESSTDGAWLSCDEERVGLVLVDLIRNAVGLTRPWSEVIVRTWSSGGEVGVEIHDFSEGLSVEERTMLAEPLWWPSWTASDTALGLCVAWVVATAHGGHVSVESTPGVGNSFWFVLPRGLLH